MITRLSTMKLLVCFGLKILNGVFMSFKGSNRFFRDAGFALPLLFLVIMWSDSYLLGHFTGLLFIFFSSFLYKYFEES